MGQSRYLVTGGNGYIGSHMCKKLHEMGAEVHIMDNASTSSEEPTHQYGEFHQAPVSLEKIFEAYKFDGVFHFAGSALVGESQQDPMKYYINNTVESTWLIKHCIEYGVKSLIFSSTCATFGDPGVKKIKESDVQQPINSYGQSKLNIESILRDIAGKGLLTVGVLRYFNVAGADPSGELVERHDPETHLIPNLCLAYLGKKDDVFTIHGQFHETKDGTCVRDYIHVCDLVDAHWKCFEHIKGKSGFYDYNLGSENGHSVKEVLAAFEKVVGKPLEHKMGPHREGDPPRLVADSKKAKKEIGFENKYSLEDCIKHCLNSYEK